MGVSCPEPNSIACDRVGLAVWLTKPAEIMTASIAGRPVRMRSPGEFVHGKGTAWEGYLQPAGLTDGPLKVESRGERWSGAPPVYARVRIVATYANGEIAPKTVRVRLSGGWG